MYRHSPVRNQRSKGIKIRHVLQVCLLVAVCFWLIFQLKRSHDKKKEFDANNPKLSLSTHAQSSDEIVTFGRKDLHPKLEETTTGTEANEETQEHEQEEEDEQEENKQEDEEQDEDKIIEEEKDDGGGGGDDENEQEKSDVVEIDQEEVDIIDEDKENDEKEIEEKDVEDQIQTENAGVSVDDDGATAHTHEAREEHYKADDASSAVTHDARNLGAQNEIKNATLEDSGDNDVGRVDNSETAKNGTMDSKSMNGGTSDIDSDQNGPPSSTTIAHNVTVSEEQSGNSSIATSVGSNATVTEIEQGSSNSTNISHVLKSTAEEEDADPSKSGNLETDNVTEESLDPDEVEQETTDSDSTHIEETEVRTDLDTLPEIETEGSNSEDTAAE